jgi:CRISPR-associated protein Csb1
VLQRYTLGLALTAFTANVSGYLRQGCSLVLDASKGAPRQVEEVYPSGARKPFQLSHSSATEFAQESATAFGVGESRSVDFDKERAKRDLAGDGKKAKGKKAKA